MGWFGPSKRERELTAQLSAAKELASANARTGRLAAAYRSLKAKYDAAQTTEDNRKHWAAADSLSATSANSQTVRRTLRNRSRYEVANNCYARGIVNTMAAYTVGAGPTLQLTWRGERLEPEREVVMREAAQRVEMLWANWAYARRLTQKLTTATMAMVVDGEAFAMLGNAKRPSFNTPVQLDVKLLECDWFDDPDATGDDSGVRVDAAGEPTEFAKLDAHPGDSGSMFGATANWIGADRVLHLFRRERPGQLRGVPQTTAALPLFAQLRRFILATITAAETAADFAAILYGDAPADAEVQEVVDAWDRVEIERGAMLTAPGGSRLAQLKAEHPNATFDEFVKALLREIARCLGVPAVIALGDASGYNYSSGRLDLQSYNRQMAVERSQVLEREMLDRLWEGWLDEALLIPDFLPAEFAATAGAWEFGWRWSEPEHVDRQKEAGGQQIELANMTTTLAREFARKGQDWETELRQRARELAVMAELGLPLPVAGSPTDTASNAGPGAGDPAADGGDGDGGDGSDNSEDVTDEQAQAA